MEPDFRITVDGFSEEIGNEIGGWILQVVRKLSEGEHALDFRRMHRIIVTDDYAGELAELSKATASKNEITHTNEEYAVGVATVQPIPKDGGFEFVPVISPQLAFAFHAEDESHYQSNLFRTAMHTLHHELCHVHDYNQKIDAMPDEFLKKKILEGKDRHIFPLAETCWSEYVATRLSARSAGEDDLKSTTVNFMNGLRQTKQLVNEEIRSFRRHGDVSRLLGMFERHGHFLPKSAAYVQGYMDGLGKTLDEISKEAEEALRGSYFEDTWEAMGTALREMYSLYPDRWKDLTVYQPLYNVLEEYYEEMGLFLENRPDGNVYVDVPFRPETMPW